MELPCSEIKDSVAGLFDSGNLDYPNALEEAENMHRIADHLKCPNLADVKNLLGYQYYSHNRFSEAKKILLEAEKLYEDSNKHSLSSTKNQLFLGLVYVLEKNYKSAIFYFERSKKTAKKLNNQYAYGEAISNLGLAYLEDKQLQKAELYLEEALGLEKEESEVKGYALQNLARVNNEMGNHQKALKYGRQAEEIWNHLNHKKGLYYVNMTLSEIYLSLADYPKRISYLNKALEHSKEIDIYINRHIVYLGLGLSYKELEDMENAKISFEKALDFSNSFSEEELKSLLENLMLIYSEEKDLNKISELVDRILDINKEIRESKLIESQKWVNNEVSLEEKEKENNTLIENQERQELIIRKRTLFIIALLAIGFFLALLGSLLFKNNQQKKLLLEKIQIQNGELSVINQKLNTSFETISTQNKSLAAKNQELKDFTSVASHDLKSPIRSILGFAGLMKAKMGMSTEAEMIQNLNFIERVGKNMYELIANLLEYTKIGVDQATFTAFSFQALLGDIQLDLDASIAAKNAKIEIGDFPESFIGDPVKLKQVLLNLMANALKFTEPSTQPFIQIHSQNDKDFLHISVKDNGIGIEEQYQEQVFGMFQRLNKQEAFEGSGIGLATCAKAVELHGGKIWVESELGKGSTFHFTLSNQLPESQ